MESLYFNGEYIECSALSEFVISFTSRVWGETYDFVLTHNPTGKMWRITTEKQFKDVVMRYARLLGYLDTQNVYIRKGAVIIS